MSATILSLLGGFVGVVVGAWLSRKTLFRLEEERGSREREMAWTRFEWEWKSERRRGLGAVRVLTRGLEQRLLMIEQRMNQPTSWPKEGHPFALELPEGQEQLASTWLSEEAWDAVKSALERLLDVDWRDRDTDPLTQLQDIDAAHQLSEADREVQGALSICLQELEILQGERDDLAPHLRGQASWPPPDLPEPPTWS